MSDVTVTLPPLIDEFGNIQIHARSGINTEIAFTDALGDPWNVSALDLVFEVKGKFSVDLEAGSTVYKRRLVVPHTSIDDLNLAKDGVGPFFALINKTADPQAVLWEGMVLLRGFKGAE